MNQQSRATIDTSTAATAPSELFVLTDEQILEIEPEAQDLEVRAAPAFSPVTSFGQRQDGLGAQQQSAQASLRTQSDPSTEHASPNTGHEAHPAAALPAQPPAWLTETMNEPQRGAEARALWEGAQRAEREAASFREVFAKPEEARAAAERARFLDDIDRAYFAGDPSQRAQLAARMMREDPAAFREMVFAGLRALEAAENPGRTRSVASAVGATLGSPGTNGGGASAGGSSPAPTAQSNLGSPPRNDSAHEAHLASYAAFERAANDDLERSVGTAIERTLEQALPAAGRADGAALKGRMTSAIRQDIEKALQGDRQLGEQVAQILAARRLDSETRAQVVRLIAERAQQLVPGATKRALSDWTQTTLAAHRGKSAHTETPSSRREVAPAAPLHSASHEHTAPRNAAARSSRPDGHEPSKGRVDYRKLSDEQVLEL